MSDKKRKQDGTLSNFIVKKAKTSGKSVDSGELGNKGDGNVAEGDADFDPATRLDEFQALLDFSLVDTEEEIAKRLDVISQTLLHGFRLVARHQESAKEVEFQVMEAEFYLQIDGLHEDPFTHGSEEQKFSGRW